MDKEKQEEEDGYLSEEEKRLKKILNPHYGIEEEAYDKFRGYDCTRYDPTIPDQF